MRICGLFVFECVCVRVMELECMTSQRPVGCGGKVELSLMLFSLVASAGGLGCISRSTLVRHFLQGMKRRGPIRTLVFCLQLQVE